ncbi:hypothetical protein JXD38_04690 [candidate division WOR-3 bacterium]|nr:hypothetical protein [candidate division WOR-3 bacterium]
MRSTKRTLIVLAVAAFVLTAWAGGNAVADNSRSDKDSQAPAVQAKQHDEDKKPDRANQSRPAEDHSPKSGDRSTQAPASRSSNAQAGKSERSTVKAPSSSEQRDRTPAEPIRIQSRPSGYEPSEAGDINVPRTSGEPRKPRGGRGGYQGSPGPGPFDRRPTHYFGGHRWHGPHDHWRYRHYRGSWRFLFYLGPVIYYPPIHYPHVIRIPHHRVGVYVRYTGDDIVGSAFANSVREQLRNEGLRVVYSQTDARLELYIISMERDPDDPGYNSAISVSYVWYPGHRFITAQMVDAGINEVDDLAASVAAYADDLVDQYR